MSIYREMLEALALLGNSATARIDARVWHRHFKRKLARKPKRRKATR